MFRLGHLVDGDWAAYSFPPIYEVEDRVTVGVPNGDPAIFEQLLTCLESPFYLLYVLHTPRGEAKAGRYQSPPISMTGLGEFIVRFNAFLSADSRFDLWGHSPSENGTVVWDRYNLIYAYGPLDRYVERLKTMGFTPGHPKIPSPHAHYYHKEFDDLAKEVIAAFDWSYSPLRSEDRQ